MSLDELTADRLAALPSPALAALFVVGAFLLPLAVLWVAGNVLSRVHLSRLSAEDARLHRDEHTPIDHATTFVYRAVLWFGAAVFYLLVPSIIALTIFLAVEAYEAFGGGGW